MSFVLTFGDEIDSHPHTFTMSTSVSPLAQLKLGTDQAFPTLGNFFFFHQRLYAQKALFAYQGYFPPPPHIKVIQLGNGLLKMEASLAEPIRVAGPLLRIVSFFWTGLRSLNRVA